MTVRYRDATLEDAEALAPFIREQDALEVYLSHGLSAGEALRISYANSDERYSIIDEDERVVGMFGCVDNGDMKGMPWLLGSDDLVKKGHSKSFLTGSKKYVEGIKHYYNHLYNYVHEGNTVSLKWLKWLGFSCDKKLKKWGLNKATFIKFSWERR